jgi:hypothetical protein
MYTYTILVHIVRLPGIITLSYLFYSYITFFGSIDEKDHIILLDKTSL